MPKIYKPKKKNPIEKNKTENYKERQKIYKSKNWINIRNAKLITTPICEVCNEKLAEDVHHIDSFMNYEGIERIEKAFDPDNLMSICKECHGKLHSKKKRDSMP